MLELTLISPTISFSVDGTEYHVTKLAYLSGQKFEDIQPILEEYNDADKERAGFVLMRYADALLAALTDLPVEQYGLLSVGQKMQIMELAMEGFGGETDNEKKSDEETVSEET